MKRRGFLKLAGSALSAIGIGAGLLLSKRKPKPVDLVLMPGEVIDGKTFRNVRSVYLCAGSVMINCMVTLFDPGDSAPILFLDGHETAICTDNTFGGVE